ncbi:hypothetical protein GCM10010168_24220 [Actinoplanes ianthinogenes]|uniref:Uncharacterized protein n=1 Tax=Actinoplanes ianthinogenes TaxID=122358 RepID=A0ABM7M8S3_9ACTN|nr:hypothetical protein [Actinoplanes ianthinogenes]BCJ48062.1 hypothetical protein Aiant_87190 [Actinoplanes ianthinogenes]GGR06139.1 hypothetical protein GCM10010168_24220 [Actinoplanes ianthinogenes]
MTDLDDILAAARELAWAGRWQRALSLLDAMDTSFPIALAAAEVALESDWFTGTALAAGRLAAAERLGKDWDLDFLRLRHSYWDLLDLDAGWSPGPAGRDPGRLADLRERAAELHTRAPDATRGGWARMYQGLICDNLLDRRDLAPEHYRAALHAGQGTDPRLEREALRHLGDHDRDAGDLDAASARWARATELSSRARMLPGLLTQQILLAVLARDGGDEAGARMLAREVARSAQALGMTRVHQQATAFLDGARIA